MTTLSIFSRSFLPPTYFIQRHSESTDKSRPINNTWSNCIQTIKHSQDALPVILETNFLWTWLPLLNHSVSIICHKNGTETLYINKKHKNGPTPTDFWFSLPAMMAHFSKNWQVFPNAIHHSVSYLSLPIYNHSVGLCSLNLSGFFLG